MATAFKRKIVRKRALKEAQGRRLMAMAEESGKLSLKRNLTLYSAAGLAKLNLKDKAGNDIEFTAGTFYLAINNFIAYRVTEPLTIIEAMRAGKNDLHTTILSKESVLLPIGKRRNNDR